LIFFDMTGFAPGRGATHEIFTQVATPNGLKIRIQTRTIADAVPL
jgi:hypothetical protein